MREESLHLGTQRILQVGGWLVALNVWKANFPENGADVLELVLHSATRSSRGSPHLAVEVGRVGGRGGRRDNRKRDENDYQFSTYNGMGLAHWEGDTLVVQTEGFRDGLWIDTWGSPMSDAAKMTEKMRRPNFGTLEIELTIDDAKVYTKPFTVNLSESLEADTDLIDEFCLEGEKDYERLQRLRSK